MLSAYLFDRAHGEAVDDWAEVVGRLTDQNVLWLDLRAATEEELSTVRDALSIDEAPDRHRRDHPSEPQVQLRDGYLHVTSRVAPGTDADADAETEAPEAGVLQALVGTNWVVTIHDADSALVDDFAKITTGEGRVGALDAPSFLATLLELVILGYSDAFEQIEEAMEEFDAAVLRSHDRDIEAKVDELVRARQRVGTLRRALAPHRRVCTTLGHAELDRVSTEDSAERFRQLAAQVDDALGAARDAKEAVVNSFDMLMLRTESRTNEIVKVLTLTSILLLPGALLAAIMGMNVNLAGSDFTSSGLFWGTLGAIVVIAGGTIGLARARRWI